MVLGEFKVNASTRDETRRDIRFRNLVSRAIERLSLATRLWNGRNMASTLDVDLRPGYGLGAFEIGAYSRLDNCELLNTI